MLAGHSAADIYKENPQCQNSIFDTAEFVFMFVVKLVAELITQA